MLILEQASKSAFFYTFMVEGIYVFLSSFYRKSFQIFHLKVNEDAKNKG